MEKGLWKRWLQGVERIKEGVKERLAQLWSQKSTGPEEWEELEEMLIATDIGPALAMELVTEFRSLKERSRGSADWREWLYGKLISFFKEGEHNLFPQAQPDFLKAIFLVGINGVGKTTTAGKLAYLAQERGEKVVLISADTFRAAANEQLAIWAERVGCRFFGGSPGADPAAVVYDGLQSALKSKETLAIVDTAGRSHVNKNLLAELEKVSRVVRRFLPEGNVENILVIDALAGQNAFVQVSAIVQVVPLTGIILTKWDSQAKGGILFRIRREFGLPVKYIGVGEGVDDLIPFDAHEFVRAIVF
ncbi:MAG: signal recognition particle-docking protein FtsY [Atribacterota bacterium]